MGTDADLGRHGVQASWCKALAVLVAGAVVAACGGGSDDDDASGGAGTSTTEVEEEEEEIAADPDGEITAMVVQVPSTLDPAQAINTSPWPYIFEIYDRLIGRDVDNDLVPMLATEWEFSDDGLELHLSLRDDVRFNDGKQLTSADVKATLERYKTMQGSAWAQSLSAIETIETPGDFEVVLRLSRPSGSLPAVFSSPAGAIINADVIASGRNLATEPGRDAGSGPRVVENYVVNSRVDFVRADDDYWDPDGNRLARVTLIRVADPVARLNALRAGEADLITVKLETSEQAKTLADQSDDYVYKEKEGSQHNVLYFNSREAPLDKVEVRRAINLAVDRDAIAAFMDGDCPAATQLFPEGQVGHDPDLDDQYTYDPDEAVKLLEQAGYPNGLDLSLTTPAGASPYEALAAVIQEQLSKVDIRVEVTPVDAASQTPQFIAGGVNMAAGTMVTPVDSSQILDKHFLGVQRLAVDVAPEVADLAIEGEDRTVPEAQWQQAYEDIARIAGWEKSLYMPVCNGKAQYLMTKDIGGFD
ncbi:MAG: ABC transporter substrate-binding protein, partial [Acidimicrobiia bacterium]